MKWDFAIGNPAYQETQEATSDKPVYNYFMDEAQKIADRVEMITPARFLFNAGKTPKAWNEKMLNDEHFKVLEYEPNASNVFPNTAITGGIAITYRSNKDVFGKIGVFIQHEQLNSILTKVRCKEEETVSSLVLTPESYKFTPQLHADHPTIVDLLSDGHKYDITSNIFEKLDGVVFEKQPYTNEDCVKLLGLVQGKRTERWILRRYIKGATNFAKFKVFLSAADGAAGQIGKPVPARIIGKAVVADPDVGHTQTFLSIGSFETKVEADNLTKYLRTKFSRTLVGILKVTQNNKKGVWKYVPIQDFSVASEIDWSKSIPEIDQQLYKKYGLSQPEIEFIETHVKEMI